MYDNNQNALPTKKYLLGDHMIRSRDICNIVSHPHHLFDFVLWFLYSIKRWPVRDEVSQRGPSAHLKGAASHEEPHLWVGNGVWREGGSLSTGAPLTGRNISIAKWEIIVLLPQRHTCVCRGGGGSFVRYTGAYTPAYVHHCSVTYAQYRDTTGRGCYHCQAMRQL